MRYIARSLRLTTGGTGGFYHEARQRDRSFPAAPDRETTMNAGTPEAPTDPASAPGSLWSVGLRAAAWSALANATLVAAGVIAGVFPRLHITPFAGPGFGLGSVVLISMAAALVGTALYSAIWHRAERPMPVFVLLVACTLLVSFAAPMFVPGWTLVRLGMMELTHIVVAAITVFTFWRWTRAETHYLEARG